MNTVRVITSATYISTCANGSPRYRVEFADGFKAETHPGSAVNYQIYNSDSQNTPVRVEFSRAGRITAVTVLPHITADDAGCWLDGSQGWHNSYRVVDRATAYGFKIPASYRSALAAFRSGDDLASFDSEAINGQGGLADQATEFLQALAPDDYSFVWDCGELSLVPDSELDF